MAAMTVWFCGLGPIQRRRLFVFTAAIATTSVKLRLAATTYGTTDVSFWRSFAASVHKLGPISIYSTHYSVPYNHPPLIGWFLVAVNAAASHGPSLRFLIRVPASLADVVTALLVFELVRVRRGPAEATLAGTVVACSPVLIVISGFHGNTDPAFVMFILLSAYLIVHDRPLGAGASAAISISIKLVPIVALPVIAAALWHHRRRLLRATVGFLLVLVPLWAPVVFDQWAGFKRNVLDYSGIAPKATQWGIVDAARHLHQTWLVDALVGPGRFFALGVSALVPAYVVLKRPDAVATAVALSLTLFLLLTTNFGTQYLAWAAAAVLLLDVWGGIAYNLTAGVLLIVTYTHWTNGFPWYQAHARRLTPGQEQGGGLVWAVLLICALLGIRRLWQWSSPRQPAVELTSSTQLDVAPRQ
jgi:Dolichyl-phosphate-mannose-protein mannosyltransferase